MERPELRALAGECKGKPRGLSPSKAIVSTTDNIPRIYNRVMIETLFKTPAPAKDRSECYVLVLTSRVSTRGTAYVFMEEHGQWDSELQRFRYTVRSINTDERLTYEQALALYENAKRDLARIGFVHSFNPDAVRKMASAEVVAEPELATA
jgi:hypothetical protein